MNTFGRIFRVSVFGESHGPQIGVTIDGVPEGLELCESDFDSDLARRAPAGEGSSQRRESDVPHILSGLFDGHTTGAPLTICFNNEDFRSEDYESYDRIPRPGHADYVAAIKWNGANDPRGGGHFSGRLTLPIVAAGVVAKKVLEGLDIKAELCEIGGCTCKTEWPERLRSAREEGDSLGGIIECTVSGMPTGLGEPFFDSVESLISHAVFSIPGIRGIEFGDGFAAAAMKGSQHNDAFSPDGPEKNGAGGINGGITNGAPIRFRVAVKPTSSIAGAQRTWNFEKEAYDTLQIKGRHDICFALRTPVIVEAVTAIVLADLKESARGRTRTDTSLRDNGF